MRTDLGPAARRPRSLAPGVLRFLVLVLALAGGLCRAGRPAPAATRVLYETGFEAFEGFRPGLDLAGQGQWVAIGDGGNGVLASADGFEGQVAYVGFARGTNDFLNLFHPVAWSPAGEVLPRVRFTVAFQVFDSTTNAPNFDDFRWSAYNTLEQRLFTLDFDNERLEVNYALDDGKGFQPTGVRFESGAIYDLTIDLDFARNRWTAWIGDLAVVNQRPITTHGAKLDLNEIDAVWAVRHPGAPGDNFMVFDDYRLVAIPATDIPPMVEPVGRLETGEFLVRILGEPGVTYVLESTTDLRSWTVVAQGVAQSPGGILELQDGATRGVPARFYRARSRP